MHWMQLQRRINDPRLLSYLFPFAEKIIFKAYHAVTVHGRKATALNVFSRPMMSAEKPTGVVKRFAIPHETPIASELTVLLDRGHFFCAIAVVTGVLA